MAKKAAQKRDGVYQRKDRKGFWITWTDANGRRRQRKTSATNITQAKKILEGEKSAAEKARVLGYTPPAEDTFGEVAARYLKYQKARLAPKSYVREESILRVHLAQFDGLTLSSIRKVDIQHYVTEAAAERSASSVQKELIVLKHLFSLAVEWEIVPINPAQGVKAPKLPAGRVRYLQPTELRALLEACRRDGLREIVALAVSTGMRRGEIMDLRFLDVDLANRRIMLPQTKNGDGRVVYLNEMAAQVFESMGWGNPTERIFSDWTASALTEVFRRLCRKLKIEDFRFHDLRHTAASWMRMSGADIHTVATLLGHRNLATARRYQHLSPAFLAEAVSTLDVVFGVKPASNLAERDQDVTGVLALTDGSDANE